jgi:hypothetical protein
MNARRKNQKSPKRVSGRTHTHIHKHTHIHIYITVYIKYFELGIPRNMDKVASYLFWYQPVITFFLHFLMRTSREKRYNLTHS